MTVTWLALKNKIEKVDPSDPHATMKLMDEIYAIACANSRQEQYEKNKREHETLLKRKPIR